MFLTSRDLKVKLSEFKVKFVIDLMDVIN